MSEHSEHSESQHTAHVGHHEMSPWQIVLESDIINIFILAIAIVYLGNKFLPKVIDERKKQITNELEKAKQARIQAEKELDEVKEKLKQVSHECEQIKSEAQKTATSLKTDIERDTEAELLKLKQKVEREISSTYEETVQNIKSSASTVAIKLAETALSQLSKEKNVQKKLIDDFMKELNLPSKN